MSVEAITWALKEPIEKSSTKFVLVALANCANSETSEAYPSVKYLSDATAQDRKTVLANLKRLVESGHISDTGKRAGSTKQVTIYRLNTHSKHDGLSSTYLSDNHYVYRLTNTQTGQFYIGVRLCVGDPSQDDYMGSGKWPIACKSSGVELEKEILSKHESRASAEKEEQLLIDQALQNPLCMNSPKTGTAYKSAKNGTINTVPNFPHNSTVFPAKESQISHETVPKTGHGTVKEPSIEPSLTNNKKKVADQSEIDFPCWLKNSDWDEFVEFRKSIKKPMTDSAKRLMVKNLVNIADLFSPQVAIEQMHLSIRNGWSDVYKPKPDQSNAYDRKIKTLNGLTGGILGTSSDAEFKSITETIDMEASNANLLR